MPGGAGAENPEGEEKVREKKAFKKLLEVEKGTKEVFCKGGEGLREKAGKTSSQ